MDTKFTDIKLSWPTYQDTTIKAIEEMAECFCNFLKDTLNMECDYELTSQGIIVTVETKRLNAALDAVDSVI